MVLVGVAGWSYDDWAGTVYPKPRPKGFHALPYLARYLDLMELNSSFYALPRPDLAANWVRLIEPFPDFRFTAKIHGAFTHGPLDETHKDQARAFCEGLSPLAEAGRLIALLAQFPVTFREGASGWERLERIAEYFPGQSLSGQPPPSQPVLLELRHRSWFDGAALERIAGLGFGLAHIDLPSARDHPPHTHPTLGDTAYLRLHGRNRRTWFDARARRDDRYDYRYDRREVRAIARRLGQIGRGTERSLIVANNHFGGQAVANALELKGLLTGEKPRAPETLLLAFPDLRQYVRPEGQLSLF